MFRIKIADLTIRIDNRYEYVRHLCSQYLTEGEEEDFDVAASEEEIQEEAENHYAGNKNNGFSLPYCESLCLYRNLCRKLIGFDAFLMHSAAIEVDGNAYVFAARSGVGKTTHMKLWLAEFGGRARVINGDKPVYRFLDGKLYAYGTPWCGKERFGNNITAPVKAISFLEQSPDNHIRKLEYGEVVSRIFHQLLMPCEEEAVTCFLAMVDRMISVTDCYLLQCNREREAALLAYGTMAESKGG